ncbi:MAG: hypothetical protein ABI939_03290 [Anaerolineaceae bacterium]
MSKPSFKRITFDRPNRTPVSDMLRLLAVGHTREQIVVAEAGLEPEDFDASLAFVLG